MKTFLFALLTIIPWGTWIGLSQSVKFKNNHIKTFYITASNLILAFVIVLFQYNSYQINFNIFWFPFIGGFIWALSSYCAFIGTEKIGLAKAVGIWTPLNILVGIIWGIIIFKEFLNTRWITLLFLILSLIMIIIGILLIIFSQEISNKNKRFNNNKSVSLGLLGALGAGVLWGSYFIPIKLAKISMWIAAFPMALGMFIGGVLLLLIGKKIPKLERKRDYLTIFISGVLWGVGNYGMLLLVNYLGTGKGFTIAQLCVVVNALIGVYIFKNPKPRTKAAYITLIGIFIALLGAVILGNLK